MDTPVCLVKRSYDFDWLYSRVLFTNRVECSRITISTPVIIQVPQLSIVKRLGVKGGTMKTINYLIIPQFLIFVKGFYLEFKVILVEIFSLRNPNNLGFSKAIPSNAATSYCISLLNPILINLDFTSPLSFKIIVCA